MARYGKKAQETVKDAMERFGKGELTSGLLPSRVTSLQADYRSKVSFTLPLTSMIFPFMACIFGRVFEREIARLRYRGSVVMLPEPV